MLTLYGYGRSRWIKCVWLLRELDVPHELVQVNLFKGEGRTPEHLARHPFGKVPALVDGEFTVFDSSAICNYLGDKFPEKQLVPKAGTRERAEYDQWMFATVADLEQPVWLASKHQFILPDERRVSEIVPVCQHEFRWMAKQLNETIKHHPFLVGNRFTAADISLAYTINWADGIGWLDKEFGNLAAYRDRHFARPHFPDDLYLKINR